MNIEILFTDGTIFSTYARNIKMSKKGGILIIDTCSEDKIYHIEAIQAFEITHAQFKGGFTHALS